MKTKGELLILVGPSGSGKSSLLDRLLKEYSDQLRDTVTYTTRPMRSGESEGNPYHFVQRDQFENLIQQNFFIEWAEVHKNLYGTPFHQLEDAWADQRVVVMDVDVQGAKTFKAKFDHARTVFILPPSIEVLRQRILARSGGEVKDLQLRLDNAQIEMAQVGDFDISLVNDDFEKAYAEMQKIIEGLLKDR